MLFSKTSAIVVVKNNSDGNTYAWFLDMRDDRIVRASAFFDSVAFNEFWTRVTPSE
jgi:ketosteroid isomerase-like protein